MRCSIVMATYNGKEYLREQLDSIRTQTRQPDEVVIVDDCSTDGTPELIAAFINKFNLNSTWKLVVNTNNKGCTKNFLDGVCLTTTDIIFYSDQDDVWDTKKIEVMMRGFESHRDMMACYCLRVYINAAGQPIPMHFERFTNVPVKAADSFQKVSLVEAVKFNKSPGLCLGIRRDLALELREMIIDYSLTHDLPVGTAAAIYDGYYVLNQRLVRYRIHGSNVSAPRLTIKSRVSNIDSQIAGRLSRLNQMKAIAQTYGFKLSTKDRALLNGAIEETDKSIQLLQSRNLRGLVSQLFCNRNPMMNPWIAVNNLLCVLRSRMVDN